MNVTFKPLEDWPKAATEDRQRSRFDTSWSETLRLLQYELSRIGASAVVIRAAFREQDIRQDGWDDIDLEYALRRLWNEVGELEDELLEDEIRLSLYNAGDIPDPERVIREAADVANFAFMIALKVQERV